jgi:hypothetical protein
MRFAMHWAEEPSFSHRWVGKGKLFGEPRLTVQITRCAPLTRTDVTGTESENDEAYLVNQIALYRMVCNWERYVPQCADESDKRDMAEAWKRIERCAVKAQHAMNELIRRQSENFK